MIILVIVPSLDEKGPNIIAKNLVKYSDHKHLEFIFYSLRNNSNTILASYQLNKIRVIEGNMRKIPLWRDIDNLKNIVNEIKPDIVHAHSFWPTIIVGLFLKKYKKVVTVHNNPKEDYIYEYGNIIGTLMTYLFHYSLKNYDSIIPISNFVKSKLSTKTQLKSRVIYNGIEDAFFPSKLIKEKDNVTLNLLTVSVLNKVKNVRQILEIIKLLMHENIDINCVIIGEGKEMINLKKIVDDYSLIDHVTFMGNIPRTSVFERMKESDAFIFTSKSEGFGLVVAESMMMGKPVIVNNIPVMWEIVDDNENGFILNTNTQFVEAIKSLLDINNRNKMSLMARKKYKKNFTIDKMVKKYEELYHDIDLKNKK